MKRQKIFISMLAIGLLLLMLTVGSSLARESDLPGDIGSQATLGTGFTYQGRLTDGNGPVNAACDFTFELYDEVSDGTRLGSPDSETGVPVSEGDFSVALNKGGEFGPNAFTGDARYLQITVNCGGDETTLSPRQALKPTPYALHALSIADGAVTAGKIGEPCAEGQVLASTGEFWSCADTALTPSTPHLIRARAVFVVGSATQEVESWVDLLSFDGAWEVLEQEVSGDLKKRPGRGSFLQFLAYIPPSSNSQAEAFWHYFDQADDPINSDWTIYITDGSSTPFHALQISECWASRSGATLAPVPDNPALGRRLWYVFEMTCSGNLNFVENP